MSKTLGDYLLEGGVKGRMFVDNRYIVSAETIYICQEINPFGLEEERLPICAVSGIVVGTNEVYLKNLTLCLGHKEYIPPKQDAQSQPKCTEIKEPSHEDYLAELRRLR